MWTWNPKYNSLDLETPNMLIYPESKKKWTCCTRITRGIRCLLSRKLTIGEEATIIETIIRILKKVDEEPE